MPVAVVLLFQVELLGTVVVVGFDDDAGERFGGMRSSSETF